MKIDLPDRAEIDALIKERDALNTRVKALAKKRDDAITTALKDITPADIETYEDLRLVSELAYNNSRAHNVIEAWVRGLGSEDVRHDGMVMDTRNPKKNVILGPGVSIWVPHISTEGISDRLTAIERALATYEAIMRSAWESVDDTDAVEIKIMDNDLSTRGIPNLIIRSDGTIQFTITRWGRADIEQEWPTMREALVWLAEHRWYGDLRTELESDDRGWGY